MNDIVGPPEDHRDTERHMFDREELDVDTMVAPVVEELRMGFEVVARIDRPAVTVFGSARTPREDPLYAQAMAVAAGFVTEGFAVVTGGGPGIMEAANRGAKERDGLSVGFNIVLPKEQGMNAFVDLGATFEHFYARKVMFIKAAEGSVVFPGGFGTQDELFEALTLIQTGKIRHFPVVLVGRRHWEPMLTWIKDDLLARGLISDDDLGLLMVTDSVSEAVRGVVDCYRRVCEHVAVAGA